MNGKRKIIAKKGKLTAKKNAKILVLPLLMAGLFLAKSNITDAATQNLNEGQEILDTLPEENFDNQTTNEIIVSDLMENDTLEIEENLIMKESPSIMITQTTCVEVVEKEDMRKREETDALFGTMIDTYTTRYGIPNCLGKALISQERPNDSFENLGQLTRNICGEKIIIPLFGENEMGLEKIYVIRDQPNRNNYSSEASYREQLDKYKTQLETSQKLAQEGFQIYSFPELLNNQELNIHISMAYLAHCIYKCDTNISQGIRSYNSGYTSAKKASDEEIANGKIEIGDQYYNKHVYEYLYSYELNEMIWSFKNIPILTEEEKRELTPEQIIQIEKDRSTNAPLIIVNMGFSNVKELSYEENGYHL